MIKCFTHPTVSSRRQRSGPKQYLKMFFVFYTVEDISYIFAFIYLQ